MPASDDRERPATFAFRGGTPNPFGTDTELRFELPAATRVRIDVHDVQGRIVRSLADRDFSAGTHQIRWDGNGDRGAALPNGVYLARVIAGGFQSERRLVLIR
jgi:flagellar hook assembly protein FlgD